MSENGEKYFDPTPARLTKARRDGDIPRAQEVRANVSLLAGLLGLTAIVPVMALVLRAALANAASGSSNTVYWDCALAILCALVPMSANALAAFAASTLQSGGVSFIPIAWKFERIDPFAGIKRMLSAQTLAQCARSTCAFAISLSIIVAVSLPLAGLAAHPQTIETLAQNAWHAVVRAIAIAGGIGLLFGFVEFAVARNAWLKRLRMTFEEYKRSMKEQDGDPQVRSRRRAFHRALSREDVRNVKKAAFVVCNPTHIAVALAYNPVVEPVPRVLVRASDTVAQHVRRIALEHNIPLVENITLARALYAEAKTGLPIPHDHYLAIAEIVVALTRENKIAS